MRLSSALAVLLVAVPVFAQDPAAPAPRDALVGESIEKGHGFVTP